MIETTLHESVVTLTLSGGAYERSRSKIRDAVAVSGIDGVTVGTFGIDRVSDTEVTVELEFDGNMEGNIDTDVTLTFTVGADAIAGYNGPALTATPVVLTASVAVFTVSPLTEATLHESVVTLTLSGGAYEQSVSDIRDAVAVSGIDGVTFGVERVSDTEITIELKFDGNTDGNIDTDATLTFTVGATIDIGVTFTVGANAIADYNGPTLTTQTPVTVNVPNTTTTGYGISVAFSSYGTLLASVLEDNTVKLWDVATNANIATLKGHEGVVWWVAFSPDGKMLASAGGDGTVRLWDVATNTNIATLEGHEGLVTAVAFSPDGKMLASAGRDATVRLWDVATNTNIATLEGHTDGVVSVAFSPDGTMLASGSWDNTVKLWDVTTWWIGQPRPQTLVKVSGDNQEGISGDALPNPLTVEVRDKDNNPLSGVGVTFTVTSGYGKLSEQSTIEYATTDANGQAETILTLGPIPGTNTVEVSLGVRTLATFNAVGVGMPTPRSMDGDYRT